MSKKNKASILHDQQPDHVQIRRQNEINLAKAQVIFRMYKTLTNQSQLEEVTDSLSTIDFLKKNCTGKLQDFVQSAAKHFKYERFKFGEVVFNYGDYGDKMYIILQGEVGVFVPRSLDDIQKDKDWISNFSLLEVVDQAWLKRRGEMHAKMDQILRKLGSTYFKDKVPQYQKVFQYYSGQSFGDVALQQDSPRTASIIILSEFCEMISINRHDYKTVCEKSIQEMNQQVDYFMKLLPGNGKFSITKFLQHFHPITFSTSTILWREGEEPKFFFLIIKGRVELYKNIEENLLLGLPKVQSEMEEQFLQRAPKKKKVILSQLSDNAFVGQEELIDGINSRSFSCQVADITQALYMEAEDFNNIKKIYPDIVKCLKEKSQQLSNYMKSRKQAIISNLSIQQNQLTENQELEQVERRTIKEIFKDQQNRPDKNHLRSYKPKVLSQTEITNQNIRINAIKSEFDQKGDFIMLDNVIIDKIRERLQRMQIVHQEPEKKERVKTLSINDGKILVNRIQSGVQKRGKRFQKQFSDVSLLIKSNGTEYTTNYPTTPSVLYKPQSAINRRHMRLRGKQTMSKHTNYLYTLNSIKQDQQFDLELAASPIRRIHTANASNTHQKTRQRSANSRSYFQHNLLF